MAQKFGMRYPLIDGHGNFGNQDGDGAASYRYTEARLTKVAEATMADIKKNSVDFQDNYSETDKEPVYLPGIFPNLLCNGTTGIAVAMATTFLPHNLTEVMNAIINAIETDNYSVENALRFITGPDFPNGGIIINGAELHKIYETGKGRVKIRGEYTIDKNKIIFTSVPYKVSKEKLTIDIDNLCEEGKLKGISLVRDESTKDGVCFVIETEKSVNPLEVVNSLFSCTDLETTVNANQVALEGKTPKLMNLSDIIKIYVQHQKEVLERVTKYDYQKVSAQLEVQQGLLKALEDIDNIIKLIKASNDSKDALAKLIEKYSFTEAQAKAILNMKLSKLSHLEKVEIEKEITDLTETANKLSLILNNPAEAKKELIKILESFKEKFGDSRITKVTNLNIEKEKELEIPSEDVVVVLTKSGYLKRILNKDFSVQKKNGRGIKNSSEITLNAIKTNTKDILMCFTNKGKMYKVNVVDIPQVSYSSKGTLIKNIINLSDDEEVINCTSLYHNTSAKYILFATKNGMVKKTLIEEYLKVKKGNGIIALNLKENDSVASVTFVDKEQILIITKNGMLLKTNSTDITSIGRNAIGVKGINLNEDDQVAFVLPITDEQVNNLAIFTENGLGRKTLLSDFVVQNRGGKGVIGYKTNNVTGLVVGALLLSDEDKVLIVGEKNSICISAKDIPLLSKTSMGNKMIKENDIIAVTKL